MRILTVFVVYLQIIYLLRSHINNKNYVFALVTGSTQAILIITSLRKAGPPTSLLSTKNKSNCGGKDTDLISFLMVSLVRDSVANTRMIICQLRVCFS